MPRAFNITSATDTVSLDVSGQGELSFTVSNALRAPVLPRGSIPRPSPSGDTLQGGTGGAGTSTPTTQPRPPVKLVPRKE